MNTRILAAGTFDPGATVDGKTVRAWRITDTRARYAAFGLVIRSMAVEFTDGSVLFADEHSYPGRR